MCKFIFFLLIGYVFGFDMPSDWLNPSDLHHSRKFGDIPTSTSPSVQDSVTEPVESKSTNQNESCDCPPQPPPASNSYLKRIVNLLLYEAHMKNFRLPKGNTRLVPLTLYFTSENLEILHEFASTENVESFVWSDFDQAFSSLFEKPEISEEKVTFSENRTPREPRRVISVDQHDYTYFIFIAIVGSLLIIGLWLLLTSGSLYKSICGLGVLNFAIALVWNLIRAYNIEKAKIRKLHSNRLNQSESFGLSSFAMPLKRLFGWGTSDESLLTGDDPMFNIDYGQIVVETLCSVLQVLPILGEKAGVMVDKFYEPQNWFVRNIIQPVQLLLSPVIIFTFILLAAVIQKGFLIKLPLFSIGIGNSETSTRKEPETSSQQHPPQLVHRTGQAFIQGGEYDAPGLHDAYVMRPTGSSSSIRRIITEFQAPEPRSRERPLRLPSITSSRKGRIMKRRHTTTVLASHYNE